MKIKRDFITNSSSVSFIIGDKTPYITEFHAKITLTVDLKELIKERAGTIEELDSIWENWYIDKNDKYDKCKKIIEEGGAIFILEVSDQNGIEERALCHEGLFQSMLPDNLIVIQGDGGY